MDIKLKKSSKLAKLIIALVILVPAILLVCMYPRMERIMLQKQEEYRSELLNSSEDNSTDVSDTEEPDVVGVPNVSIRDNVVNYAVESAYYLYGRMLQEAKGEAVDFSVLNNYGWINDFYTMNEESYYYAEYASEGGSYTDSNGSVISLNRWQDILDAEDWGSFEEFAKEYNIVGALKMEFDTYGNIEAMEFKGVDGVEYADNLYRTAKTSIDKYQANAEWYLSENSATGDVFEVQPKNFKIMFLLPRESDFVSSFTVDLDYYISYFNNPEHLYVEIGVPFAILFFMIFVALAAVILPFFKKLNTGWEKLFSMPLELICCVVAALCVGIIVMFEAMCYSTRYEIGLSIGNVEILGYVLNTDTIYGLVLAGNALGWAAYFFLEYIVVAHVRQFFCGPVSYFKHRILVISICRWTGRQIKRVYHYITDIDITKKLHGSILKIVIANMIVVGLLTCFWFVGTMGVAIYSVLLYIILRKEGKKLQNQYNSILHATEQMADGELKITLDEDLGVFSPLGQELEKVQEGFSKAVAEEAKSQNMKTELISNVSHDLKTPLTAIITYINLLKREGITEEERQNYINTLDMKSQRLKVLIEDLFEVSKAQSGNIQLNYMDVDVVSLMKQLRLEMEDKIADSDLTFRWNLPEEKVILKLDGQKTYRVFENLLSNALKYAMPHSRVYIDIINGESTVEIIFKNISAAEINVDTERLTERFVRGDASRTSEGSGLGLAIVNSFVELQGGSFRIDVDGDLFKAVIIWKKL